jgi:glycosyltransferase involved in cell wall biosynthesis
MNIIFSAPRVHNNQIYFIRELSKFHSISFIIQNPSNLLRHDLVDYYVVNKNPLLTYLLSLLIKKKKESFFYIPKLIRLYRILRIESPDVVVIRDKSIFSLVVKIVAIITTKAKIILYDQTPVMRDDLRSYKYKLSKFFFNDVRITPINSHCKNLAIEQPEKNATYLPFCIEKLSNLQKEYFFNGKPEIIVIGKYQAYKNLESVIYEISQIMTQFDFQITFVGELISENENYYKELVGLIDCMGLSNRVTLIKNLPYEEVSKLLMNSDIMINSSIKDIAPFSVLEGMSHGIAVICSVHSGTSSYITNGYDGFKYNPANNGELSSVLKNLLINRELIEYIGKNALSNSIKNHNCYSAVKVFNEVLGIL